MPIRHYGHTAFTVVDGALPAEPQHVVQGYDGYIWVSTESELLSFDGVRFERKFSRDSAASPVSITSVFPTRDGSLWLGFADGRLQRNDRAGKSHIFVVPSGAVYGMLEDPGGSIWFTTTRDALHPGSSVLCKIQGDRQSCFDGVNGPLKTPTCCLTGIAEDGDGNLWLGTDTSLIKWRDGSPPITYSPAALARSTGIPNILSIVADGKTVWAAMGITGKEGGLQRIVDGQLQPFVSGGFDSSQVSAVVLYLDRHGALWVGTDQSGLYRIYKGSVDHIGIAEGLSSRSILSIAEDRDGGLWVATARGLDHFRDLRVETLSGADGLEAEQILSLLQRQDGSTWIGADFGLQILRGGRVEPFGDKQGLAPAEITAMFESSAGDVWIGTGGLLHVYRHGRFKRVRDKNGQDFGLVKSIAEGSGGDIWVEINGTTRRLVRLHDDQVAESLESPQFPTVYRVASGHDGDIWLSLAEGRLGRLRQGHLDTISYDDLLPPHRVASLMWQLETDSSGRVLAATDFGLLGFDHGTRRVLTSRNGLPCGSILQFVTDASGNLWLASACGYTRVLAAELEGWWRGESLNLTPLTLGVQDGAAMTLATFHNSGRLPDGRLAFGTTAGVQLIDPAHVAPRAPPPPRIEAVVADRQLYGRAERVTLPKRTRDIEIDYTAFNFNLARSIEFRYRLHEYDTDWQPAGSRRQAFYSNLAPGQYHFSVSSSNGDGTWNAEPATLLFVIPPAYFQTRWFLALMVLAAALLLSALFSWRMKEMKARLRALLEGRLAERERIARELHDTLLQGVQGLILKFQDAAEEMPENTVARRKMEEALNRADDVLIESRDRVKDLRITQSSGPDLAVTIGARGAELAKQHSIPFDLSIEGVPRQIEPIVAEEMLRIADEALANAFRHARAARIEAEILYERAALRLRVRDDGCGIDDSVLKEGRPDHWGLPGMHERARRLRASFAVWSRPNAGTEIDLRVPARIAYVKRESAWTRLWRRGLRKDLREDDRRSSP